MKFTFKIPKEIQGCFYKELEKAGAAQAAGNLSQAWHHLERAHILGQAYPLEHSYAHWKMLRFGFHIKSSTEIRGQIIRLLAGGVKSFVGKIPVGNTGGANVNPMQPMKIPADLEQILCRYR